MNLPKSAEVNRFVAKKKFYEHSNMAESIKNSFVNDLEKITWSYKLSEDTMNLSKTDIVNEIEIFTLNVTKKNIPNSIIKTINKLIPYKILFKIVFENNYCYAIYEKETIYNTEWNENLDFKFNGLNLENVWNNIIKHIINEDNNSISIIPEIIPTFIHELVVSNKHIVQITCGDSFSIALSNLGEVYSWGNGPEGQLGLGDIRFTYEPTVFMLVVVSMHSCASLFFHTTSHQSIHVTIIQSVMTTIIICIPGVITSMDSWELETSRIAMSPTEYPSSLLFIVCRFLFIASRK